MTVVRDFDFAFSEDLGNYFAECLRKGKTVPVKSINWILLFTIICMLIQLSILTTLRSYFGISWIGNEKWNSSDGAK